MKAALYVLLGAAAALAWAIARKRSEHRPLAWALSVALLSEAIIEVLLEAFPPTLDPSAPPHQGTALLAVYANRALFLVWPGTLAALALRVLARAPAWPAGLAYLAASAYAIGSYPELRFESLRKFYLGVELTALLIGFVSMFAYGRRAWRKESPDISVVCASLLVAAHFVAVLSTYGGPVFPVTAWLPMRAAYLVILSTVVLLQGGTLWLQRSNRAS